MEMKKITCCKDIFNAAWKNDGGTKEFDLKTKRKVCN